MSDGAQKCRASLSGSFHLAELAIEWFGDVAVVFLFRDDRFVTLDRAGGELLERARAELPGLTLDAATLSRFLTDHYDLLPAEADAAAGRLATSWLDCGLFKGD